MRMNNFSAASLQTCVWGDGLFSAPSTPRSRSTSNSLKKSVLYGRHVIPARFPLSQLNTMCNTIRTPHTHTHMWMNARIRPGWSFSSSNTPHSAAPFSTLPRRLLSRPLTSHHRERKTRQFSAGLWRRGGRLVYLFTCPAGPTKSRCGALAGGLLPHGVWLRENASFSIKPCPSMCFVLLCAI
jgi:hypothetical protein